MTKGAEKMTGRGSQRDLVAKQRDLVRSLRDLVPQQRDLVAERGGPQAPVTGTD
jgi:hypothetical protein